MKESPCGFHRIRTDTQPKIPGTIFFQKIISTSISNIFFPDGPVLFDSPGIPEAVAVETEWG